MNQTRNEYSQMVARLAKPLGDKMDLIHGALGAASEAGELAGAIKDAMVYGKPLDQINVVEEAGDAIFFIELTLQKLGLTLEDAKRANVAKLSARYQDGYSDAAALGRKKDFERRAIAIATWNSEVPPELQLEAA